MPELTPSQHEVLATLIKIFCPLSAICSLTVILVVMYLSRKYPKDTNRISFKLQLGMCYADLFLVIAVLISANLPKNQHLDLGCKLTMFVYIFASIMLVAFATCIALNLLLVFVFNRITRNLQKYYISASLILSVACAAIPLILNKYGYDVPTDACWFYDRGSVQELLWEYATMFFWMIVGIIFCLAVVIIVARKLFRESSRLKRSLTHELNDNLPKHTKDTMERRAHETSRKVHRAVQRIIGYPLVPILTYTFTIVKTLYSFTPAKHNYAIDLIRVVTSSSPGVFNFVAFLMDPILYKLYRQWMGNPEITDDKEGWHDSFEMSKHPSSNDESFFPTDSSPIITKDDQEDEGYLSKVSVAQVLASC
ncbi:hypothetical protein K493DRAFT_304490 [Basidiobolus meristosporus CBS 931.73]|uniref:G-protein coupled receptors family 1 profile domain-containing protein n=1 Tax=Basidiobolus meristosporus CBS 931.73 TaxID=1314790 RepID=A0A1Y1XYX4_9FUNG|nr:hypothetical protein K493DRAFT_304490 [Basidiobolus meristosporus CBS 931.73]|eukprot:ORX90941.1 hypothetical protein K493DRAFT_304490 [Basidiobolus meristosporus CBS 931.73]